MTGGSVPRRTFLGYGIGFVGAMIGGMLGVPMVTYAISPALDKPETEWKEVGRLEDFPVGVPKLITVDRTRKDGWVKTKEKLPLFVFQRAKGDVTIYDVRCTHLGCPVSFKDSKYFSPCHGGVFDLDGRVLAGPPPRPLDRYEVKVENGKLYAGAMFRVNDKLDRIEA